MTLEKPTISPDLERRDRGGDEWLRIERDLANRAMRPDLSDKFWKKITDDAIAEQAAREEAGASRPSGEIATVNELGYRLPSPRPQSGL